MLCAYTALYSRRTVSSKQEVSCPEGLLVQAAHAGTTQDYPERNNTEMACWAVQDAPQNRWVSRSLLKEESQGALHTLKEHLLQA